MPRAAHTKQGLAVAAVATQDDVGADSVWVPRATHTKQGLAGVGLGVIANDLLALARAGP